MATSVDDVARSVLSSVASNAGYGQVIRWVSERYRQLSNQGRMRHLRRVGEIVIPRALSSSTDGLVTATRGSKVITGDATAVAAWAVEGPLHGRHFRYRRNWYRINAEQGNTLLLDSEVSEEDSTLVAYKIVQRDVPMPSDMRMIGRATQQRLWRPLTLVSLSELDLMHPERLFVAGTGPELYCESGVTDQGNRTYEFYPYPVKTELIRFIYWIRSPELRPGDNIPEVLDLEVLRTGVLIDLYRYEMAEALRANKVEVASVWSNNARAQESTWSKRIQEALRADRGAEDDSEIIHTHGPATQNDIFIRTGTEDAWSRLNNFP